MKILIAEDEDFNRELLKEFLTNEGYEVLAASDGQKLIEIALKNKPDLIITDIQMPNISGDTMITMIEEYEDLSDIPIIVTTGIGEKNYKNLGMTRNIEVIFKPIDLEKLKSVIKKYVK